MARRKTHGKTRSGKPITEEMIAELAQKAEAGYDVDETLRRRPGRPPLGSAAASVESVRLDPDLRAALARRAEHDHETVSAVIRKALRRYLETMPQGNAEVVRAVFDAQRRGDWQEFSRLYDPDIEWEDVSGLWGDWGTRRGFEDVQAAFLTWFEAFERVEFTGERIVEAGDEVFSSVRITGRGRESGVVADQRFFAVWTVHGGRVVRVRGYREEAEALEAAGLAE